MGYLLFQVFDTALLLGGVAPPEGKVTEPASKEDISMAITIRIAMMSGFFLMVLAFVLARALGPLRPLSYL